MFGDQRSFPEDIRQADWECLQMYRYEVQSNISSPCRGCERRLRDRTDRLPALRPPRPRNHDHYYCQKWVSPWLRLRLR